MAGPGLVIVTYGLETVGDVPVTVSLTLSTDGGATYLYPCTRMTGDVGVGVLPGASHYIIWNAGVDVPGVINDNCRLRVTADDGQVEVPEGFVLIPPGTFTMGSPTNEPQRDTDETQHPVTLTHGFYMSKYEVTEQRWYQVMGGTPSTSQLPKAYVSWDLAVQYCNALSIQEGLTPAYTIHGTNGNATWNRNANGYRLPTEAEWEYACRAGTTLAFNNNTNCLSSNTEANYNGGYPMPGCPTGIYRGATTVVGSFPANQRGLYDMHGNLWEWVWDGYRGDYQNLPQVDPVYDVGPGAYRVGRGGGWRGLARYCRSADRYFYYPYRADFNLGFRPVRSAFDGA